MAGNIFVKHFSKILIQILFSVFIAWGTAFADIVIDNNSPTGTSSTGTWQSSGAAGFYGTNSLYARPNATFTWQFDSQPVGDYRVWMRWTEYPRRGQNISVQINTSSGPFLTTVNQLQDGGVWNNLGIHSFNGFGSVTITASNQIASDGRYVTTCADVVWFEQISGNASPQASIISISPSPALPGETVTFSGSGTDPDGAITEYHWSSSLVLDEIGTTASFDTSSLSVGTHEISFFVVDNEGSSSNVATETLTVANPDIIVDNLQINNDSGYANVSSTGTWKASGAPNPYLGNSLYARPNATYTWQFHSQPVGNYEVFMRWAAFDRRGSEIQVQINTADEPVMTTVNQLQDGGAWNSLGVHAFDGSGSVIITASGEIASDGRAVTTCADAVRFAYAGPIASDVDGDQDGYTADVDCNDADSAINPGVTDIACDGIDQDCIGGDAKNASCTDADLDGFVADVDCNDGNAAINPGAPEVCNGVDDDCDTVVDEGFDGDGDGYTICGGDCNDTKAGIKPGAVETCNGIDDDCNGFVDEGFDVDGDGYTSCGGDCNDSNAGIKPGAFDICGDGIDQDCSGSDAVGADGDGDGYTTCTGDCNDGNAAIKPGAVESCNGVDDDCDGSVDEGFDGDGDGYTTCNGDCNDGNAAIKPGVAEVCEDGIDQDCSGADLACAEPLGNAAPVAVIASIDPKPAGRGGPVTLTGYGEDDGSAAPTCVWESDIYGVLGTDCTLTTSALVEGIHTISLTVTDDEGVPCLEPATQKLSVGTEHIFVCDGFAGGDIGRRWPEFESTLQSLGAVENSSGTWVYERSNPDITYFVHECHSPEEMREALTWPEAHVMFSGHSNYGLGAVFSTPQEWGKQRIEDIRYADDDRVLVVGSDMYATDYAGMKYGQAYPNWELINKDGTSAIMPYDFSEGTPPYNYYLTYTIPGDPIHYPLERPNGSWYDRFNGDGARTPIWYSPEGLKPDPDLNPEYFITNPGPFNHSEFVGEWPNDEGWIDDRVSGSVYQYHEAGTGANTATYTFVVEYPGDYDVKASWLGKWYNASNTPFTIQHADGVTTVLANQRKSVGNVEFAWNYLGTFRFEAGVYTVQISDNANDRVVADSISLQSPGQLDYYVQPEFRADVTQGDAPLTVTFDNLSYTSVSGDDMYRWTFGDGSISTEPDPVHTYSSPGIYTVSLRVTDPEAHVKTMTKEGFIVAGIAAPLRAEFATSRRRGPLPRNVSFTDQSSGEVTAWHWDFGDGSTSDEQNPSHAYETVGLFDVSLTVTGPDGENTHTEIEYVYTYASITVDDQMRHKPHFGRKVVLDTRGPHKIPEEELQYSRLFYLSCFSGKYFISTFHQGKMFYTKNNWRQGHMGPFYIKMYLTGSSDLEILDFMNGKEDIYEFYDFNLKPPSMR